MKTITRETKLGTFEIHECEHCGYQCECSGIMEVHELVQHCKCETAEYSIITEYDDDNIVIMKSCDKCGQEIGWSKLDKSMFTQEFLKNEYEKGLKIKE